MKKAILGAAGALVALAGCVAALRGPANPPVDSIAGMPPNDLCHICHIPFSEEPLAVGHAKSKVWCQSCHGPSGAHMENEKIGATKPDKVFHGSQVDRMCSRCHERRDHPKVAASLRASRLAESKKLQTEIRGRPAEPTGLCTDCHGRHWAPTKN